jgi:hypothetical protein
MSALRRFGRIQGEFPAGQPCQHPIRAETNLISFVEPLQEAYVRIHRVSSRVQIEAKADRLTLNSVVEAQAEALWVKEAERRGQRLFNGKLFNVDHLASDHITGHFVEYRLFNAQRLQPALFAHLQIRPLAVSGVVESPDGLVFGRRNIDLTTDPGRWELAPSGGLDFETCREDGEVDYMRQFYRELVEEVGIRESHVTGVTPFAIIEDTTTHVLDLCIAARTSLSAFQIREAFSQASDEYSELRLVPLSAIAQFAREEGPNIVSATTELLRYCGHVGRT